MRFGWRGVQRLAGVGTLLLGAALLSGCRQRDSTAADRFERAEERKAESDIVVRRGVSAAPEGRVDNRLGMELVWVPGGEFLMGSWPSEKWHEADERQHAVRVGGFYLATCEVTHGQFRRFIEATGYRTEAECRPVAILIRQPDGTVKRHPVPTWRDAASGLPEDRPVIHVSWNDAAAFCQWLSRVEGRPYRLPTEAEWEYACRAGTKTVFFLGDDEVETIRSANVLVPSIPVSNYERSGQALRHREATRVGSFPPNAFGLHDMHGNVWEWCADWYDPEYYRQSPRDNPEGPASGTARVLRGGCYELYAPFARSANRAGYPPQFHDHTIGFRVAMTRPAGVF